jgi:hypothetical protein
MIFIIEVAASERTLSIQNAAPANWLKALLTAQHTYKNNAISGSGLALFIKIKMSPWEIIPG